MRMLAVLAGFGALVAADSCGSSCAASHDEASLLQTQLAVAEVSFGVNQRLLRDAAPAITAKGSVQQPRGSLGNTLLVERIANTPSAAERLELVRPLAWLHIPKCGDSFANVILAFSELWFPCPAPGAEVTNDRDACDAIFLEATAACPSVMTSLFPEGSDRGFCGHALLGVTYEQTSGHIVAMFRQPEQRILSSYYGTKEDGSFGAGGWVSPQPPSSALEFALAAQGCMAKVLARAQTTGGITGTDPCAPPAVSSEEVALAKARVREGFAFVGLTDLWDMSICLFHAKFGGACLASDVANIHPGPNSSAEPYDPSVLEGFKDEADGAVYDTAYSVFLEDLERFGLSDVACAQLCPESSLQQHKIPQLEQSLRETSTA